MPGEGCVVKEFTVDAAVDADAHAVAGFLGFGVLEINPREVLHA